MFFTLFAGISITDGLRQFYKSDPNRRAKVNHDHCGVFQELLCIWVSNYHFFAIRNTIIVENAVGPPKERAVCVSFNSNNALSTVDDKAIANDIAPYARKYPLE
jgi:hypothetical protein